MKAHTVSNNQYYACKVPGSQRFPNAAGKRYYLDKIADGALAAAIALAAVVIVIVLLTM